MKTERDQESPLSQAEVHDILAVCSTHGLLVGGQALAFWADHLQVSRPPDLASGVTADADFIGDAHLARRLARHLGWKIWIPSIDEATPQTAKVTKRLRGGLVKQIDFLSGVAGLNTKDLSRRAIEVRAAGIGILRVIHPIDVLDSRIQNLHLIAAKRTEAGVAQARLAVDVAYAYIRNEITSRGERTALRLLERVAEITVDIAALQVYERFGIDPLAAVPIEDFRTTTALHRVRWPQILAEVARRRYRLKVPTSSSTDDKPF